MSLAAAALIRQLLHPHPRGRPTIRAILQDAFFAVGYFPPSLSSSCCSAPPVFPPPPQLHHHHQHSSSLAPQQPYHHLQLQQQHHSRHSSSSGHSNNSNNNNNVFQSTDNISKLTSSVHNLALPDPTSSSPSSSTVVVSPPTTSPMIHSPLPPTTGFYRGTSLADLTIAAASAANQATTPIPYSGKSANRSPSALPPPPPPLHQQHTVVSLLSGGPTKTRTTGMYEALVAALGSMPSRVDPLHSPTTKDCPVFITKWIDYSNKYGFGFQLSDRSVGVLFNDNTRISYSHDRR